MFGGGGGSVPSYFVEVTEEEDVASYGGLGQEHCLLYFDVGGKEIGGGGKVEAKKELRHFLVAGFVGWVILEVVFQVNCKNV